MRRLDQARGENLIQSQSKSPGRSSSSYSRTTSLTGLCVRSPRKTARLHRRNCQLLVVRQDATRFSKADLLRRARRPAAKVRARAEFAFGCVPRSRLGDWFDFNVIDTRQDHKSRSSGFCVHHNEARFRLLGVMRAVCR